MTARQDLPYVFGLRGVLSTYVMLFHLNYIVLAALPFAPPAAYAAISNVLRYGDFRVATFFVISGYLLTIPTTRTAGWSISQGIPAFLKRRATRLLIPYYAAFALSCVFFVAWMLVTRQPINGSMLRNAIVSHVLLIHNLNPRWMLLVNDALWNVALEFQAYLLFVFAMLPLMRRFGPWTQFFVVLAASLAPHFLLHGFGDWVRPWFIALFSLGVATMAISNKKHAELGVYERRIPWGWIWLGSTIVMPLAVWKSGMDTPYGEGWLQNLILGLAVAAFFTFVRIGMPGTLGPLARKAVALLELPALRRLGVFSYSTYLIHYPTLRLLVGIATRFTHSFWVLGGLAIFVFVPFTLWLAFQFHVRVERPFQAVKGNPAAQEIAAERALGLERREVRESPASA